MKNCVSFVYCPFLLQFNFVGRILGPRGMTAKQLEQETGCKIMVRGKGSMRDKKKVSFHRRLKIADNSAIRGNIVAHKNNMEPVAKLREHLGPS